VTGGAPLPMRFTGADLPRLRLRVADAAAAAGLDEDRCEELVLAVYELACNAILHGGGAGRLVLSRADGSVRCQVSDDGPGFPDAMTPDLLLADSSTADAAIPGGGLWLARQLTDEIEIDGGADTRPGGADTRPSGAVVTLMVRCRSRISPYPD
jgi:anti-sigma regulatory factor (Ser/Thr protein kinase)